jgi:serine/threonine-protein kinase
LRGRRINVRRFKNEAEAARNLIHPNIIRLYDIGNVSDIYFIEMEYISGETLKDIIKRKGRLDINVAVKCAEQICDALDYAHRKHIVHRDIKSQNIMVLPDGNIKVGGLRDSPYRRRFHKNVAGSGILGSVHYFSPEQAKGEKVDERSDIYSLGIVLFEMLTAGCRMRLTRR